SLQGVRPTFIQVVLGNQEHKRYRTDDYFYFYRQLKNAFLKQQANFNANAQPEVYGLENFGRWDTYIREQLERCDHISRVANIRRIQIKRLRAAEITTLAGLGSTRLLSVSNMLPATFHTLRAQARLQAESKGLEKPKF